MKTSAFLVAIAIGMLACGPTGQSAQPADGQGERPTAPKVLTLAMEREPDSLGTFVGSVGGSAPTTDIAFMVHNYLVVENDRGVDEPQLAVEIPSLERGTWRINPDGTMDTTWKIRPGVRWQNGAPFTVKDLVFSFTAHRDPDLPRPRSGALETMERVTAIDDHTLSVHWSGTFIEVSTAAGLDPLPAHLLEAPYRDDKANFVYHPLFTTEFMGLGPYRLVRWDLGSQMELARFDDYYRGRSAFDRVIVRFVPDANARVANILAESVDVVLPGGIDLDVATELRQRWVGTGHRVQTNVIADLEMIEFQHRAEYARPRGSWTERAVRQALFHAIDRQSLVDAAAHGLAPAADSWLRPDDPLRAELARSIPQFPYDLSRAQQLLQGAGWRRGADGVLENPQIGERFEIEIRARDASSDRTMNIVGDFWKAAGAQPSLLSVPSARRNDREYESTRAS